MIRALRAGKRRGTPVQVVILTLLVVLAGVCVGLAIRSVADADQARAAAASDRAALVTIRAALAQQCSQDLTRDGRLRSLEVADVTLQRNEITAVRRLPAGALRTHQLVGFQVKLAADLNYLELPDPAPAVCRAFSDPLLAAYTVNGARP